ncbi:hypothetical protein E2C01_026410 [Portunus trituberculatus]|uniref:Uncharacterized protein n=1 Tax=Portunus trituberculatus TaxID=210409 RepID=A0A5B7EFC4_PORTR|nr:hypothetical protein [Portunus trituberculatus]
MENPFAPRTEKAKARTALLFDSSGKHLHCQLVMTFTSSPGHAYRPVSILHLSSFVYLITGIRKPVNHKAVY